MNTPEEARNSLADAIVRHHTLKANAPFPDPEQTPYQCYWRDRALAAEKLNARLLAATKAQFTSEVVSALQ